MSLFMYFGFVVIAVLIFGVILALLAISNVKLWIELKSMQKSTHTLTYIDPLTQSFNTPTKDDEAAIKSQNDLGQLD